MLCWCMNLDLAHEDAGINVLWAKYRCLYINFTAVLFVVLYVQYQGINLSSIILIVYL